MLVAVLAGCAKAPAAAPAAQPAATSAATAAVVLAPTATAPAPSATPTQAATALPTATTEPTAAPTEPPAATPTTAPTATPQALAVLADGFNAWCAPQEYARVKPTGPDAPDYARKLTKSGDLLQVGIPAAYCVLAYRFNQAAPEGTMLTFFDGKSPFLKLALKPVDGKPEQAWSVVNHTFVINPPKWSVKYTLSVSGPDGKELWSNPVRFAKPLPKPCQFGGYPDPVTMWCTPTDPWEIEPWPDVHYPYPRNP